MAFPIRCKILHVRSKNTTEASKRRVCHVVERLIRGGSHETHIHANIDGATSAAELDDAVHRLKRGKASDEYGRVAELLHHVSITFFTALHAALNQPIASVLLLYKNVAYMLLA